MNEMSADERPPYAFCTCSPQGEQPHLRRVIGALKLRGGIKGSALCGEQNLEADLDLRITNKRLADACPACVRVYDERTGPSGG